MTDDPYTMDARLCDDQGMVSHERVADRKVVESEDTTYLDRLNRWRRCKVPVEEPFPCTGHAHLMGEHMRCTSPFHTAPHPFENTSPWEGVLDANVDPAREMRDWSHLLEKQMVKGSGRILMAKPGDIISELMDQAGIPKAGSLSEAWEEMGASKGKIVYAESELIPENKVYQLDGAKIFEGTFQMETSATFEREVYDKIFDPEPIPLRYTLSITNPVSKIPIAKWHKRKARAAQLDLDKLGANEQFGRRWWKLLWTEIKHDFLSGVLEHSSKTVDVHERLDMHNVVVSGVTV